MEEDKSKVLLMHKSIKLNGTRLKTGIFLWDSEALEMFGCEFCGFESNLKVDLNEHFRVFHYGKSVNEEFGNILRCYRCKNCDFYTHSVLVFAKHSSNCEDVRRSNSDYEQGCMCEENKISPMESEKWTSFMRYKCKLCSCQTAYEGFTEDKAEQIKPREVKWHECEQCTFRSKKKSGLTRHIIAKHTHAKDINWFECDQCAYKSKNKGDLKKHVMLRHANPEDVNWFECQQCAFKCKIKHHLKDHVKAKHSTPEEINWFQCDHCTYKSKWKSHLKTHVVWKHTNPEDINWFKCELCSFTSKEKGVLKKHIIAKHTNQEDINWFQCKDCAYKAKAKHCLKTHILRKHTYP